MRLYSRLWLIALVAACSDPFAAELTRDYISVATGGEHTCAIAGDGSAYCWGRGLDGELGNGKTANQERPERVRGDVTFEKITAGESHTCALATDGQIYCWGWDAFYQRGNPDDQRSAVPVAVKSALRFRSVSAGSNHTCALSADSLAYCWGLNRFGQTGDGTTVTGIQPKQVLGGTKFIQITASGNHTCALTRARSAFCWGSNYQGQLGTGSSELMVLAPTPVVGTQRFRMIDAGASHTCGVEMDGRAFCWGSNEFGELGNGTFHKPDLPAANVPGPTSEFLPDVTVISAGAGHTCAASNQGRAWCWGRGTFGQLANGSTANHNHAQPLLVDATRLNLRDRFHFTEMSSDGATHACGLAARAVFCWGSGTKGQLGMGDRFATQPQRVND